MPATTTRRPTHVTTTAHLRALVPPPLSAGSPPGLHLGTDLSTGTPFRYDPFELYSLGALSNPNMLVLGQVGRGKSALVKAYVARSLCLGRRVVVLDRKGEFTRLCTLAGTRPLRLERGGAVRINPLDVGGSDVGDADAVRADRLDVLAALAGAAGCGAALSATERAALAIALDRVTTEQAGWPPTLAQVSTALLSPRPQDTAPLGMTAEEMGRHTRELALQLRRLVAGDLAGMVDGRSAGIDLGQPLTVVDLSAAAAREDALAALVVCVSAHLRRALAGAGEGRPPTILVIEEAWACLRTLETARWLQSLQKLSRQLGLQVVLVLHRLSDLAATGDVGSEVLAVTRGLLADTETHVVFGVHPAEVDATRELLGLSAAEAATLPELPRGRALIRLRDRSALVDVDLGERDRWMCDTDSRMRTGAPVEASR